MNVLFTYIGNNVPHVRPIGLSILIAILIKDGHQVQLFDTTFMDIGRVSVIDEGEQALMYKPTDLSKKYHKYDSEIKYADPLVEFEEKIEEFRPDLIASSITSDMLFPTLNFLENIKRVKPQIPTILGGVGVTVDPDFAINQEAIDYICVCEGENALRDFIAALEKGEDTSNIDGIWSRKNGKTKKNPVAPPVDLDSLPFLNWDLYDQKYSYKPYRGNVFRGGDVMITRGCPFSCSYCDNAYIRGLYKKGKYKYIRAKSVERAIEELVYLKDRYNIEFMKIHDESFLYNDLDYWRSFSSEYKKKINIPFTCQMQATSINKETARILKDVNCVSVSLGFESGDENYRKHVLNKRVSDKCLVDAVRELKNQGIRVVSFNMFGLPHQTRHLLWETIRLNRKAKPDVADVGFYFPYKGPPLREECKRMKLYDSDKDRSSYYRANESLLDFPPKFKKEMQRMQKCFNLYVKLPRILYPIINISGYNNVISRGLIKILTAMFLKY